MQFYGSRNVCNHFGNLFDDVKHKLEHRTRLVHTHFPVSADITNDGKILRLVITSQTLTVVLNKIRAPPKKQMVLGLKRVNG